MGCMVLSCCMQVNLQRCMAPTGVQRCRWIVRHEGRPLRGKAAADLPASVRAVTDSKCSGEDVLAFWQAMGFQLDHEMLQEGHLYILGRVTQLQVHMATK
jgi:Med18 protein